MSAVRECVDQREIAELVQEARHAERARIDELDGFRLEQRRAAARDTEPMMDVRMGLAALERLEMKIDGNALRELAQFGAAQLRAQLGLTDEQNLENQILVRIDVRQQSQLFEHLDRQVLRFVENQQGAPAFGVLAYERIDERLVFGDVGIVGRSDAERRKRPAVYRLKAAMGIADEPDGDLLAELREQPPHEVVLPDPMSPVSKENAACDSRPYSNMVSAMACWRDG